MSLKEYKDETLLKEIKKWTNYKYNNVKVKIPYFISDDNVTGGKNSIDEITNYISTYFSGDDSSASQIQSFIDNNKHKCGIDCSGFVYNVLNEVTNGQFKKDMGKTANNTGVSHILSKSSTVSDMEEVRPKDLIFFYNPRTLSRHIAVIYKIEYRKNIDTNQYVPFTIMYAHSSEGGDKGPHFGQLNLSDPNNLGNCSWYDSTKEYGNLLKGIVTHIGTV